MIRKEDQDISQKIFLAQPLGSRERGRPKLRWKDEVDKNATNFRSKELVTGDLDE